MPMVGPEIPLRKLYSSEYNSWRNAKTRAKEEKVALDPRFEKFEDFFRHMGKKPGPKHTLDRIQQGGPYTLENVRWADKTTQANNRRNTRRMHFNGEFIPITEVARRTGEKPDTLRRRVSRGGRKAETAPSFISSITRQAEIAAIQSRQLEPFRWVAPDEKVVRFWASLYLHGEDDEHGTHAVVLQRKSSTDHTSEDETFTEFMVRMDTGILEALRTGDLSALPDTVGDILSNENFNRRHQLEVSEARLAISFAASLKDRFGSDPLVDDQSSFACDVTWLDETAAKLNAGALARRAHDRFRQAKVPIPRTLERTLADLSRLPLGRKNLKT
jgi:hypothetical protein